MELPETTMVAPRTDGPPQGLILSGTRQTTSPVLASRQKRARSPTPSLSRNAEQTSTRSPTTLIGASTCHLSLPCCQSSLGSAWASWSSDGGNAKGSVFLAISYFARSSLRVAALSFWSSGRPYALPFKVALSISKHRTPAWPPPT